MRAAAPIGCRRCGSPVATGLPLIVGAGFIPPAGVCAAAGVRRDEGIRPTDAWVVAAVRFGRSFRKVCRGGIYPSRGPSGAAGFPGRCEHRPLQRFVVTGGPQFPGWPRHSPSSVGVAIPQPAVFPPFGPGVCARRTVFSKFCFLTPSAFARAVLFCPGLRGGRAAYRGAGRAGDSVRALSQNRTLCRARRNFARLSGRCPVTPPPRGATMAAGREHRVFHNAAGIPPYQ